MHWTGPKSGGSGREEKKVYRVGIGFEDKVKVEVKIKDMDKVSGSKIAIEIVMQDGMAGVRIRKEWGCGIDVIGWGMGAYLVLDRIRAARK